jgi:hypothetical protein
MPGGYFFSDCLKVCTKGKLFDMGFQYIKDWKQLATTDFGVVRMGNEIDKIELEFLESCADQNNLSMMKNYLNVKNFVKLYSKVITYNYIIWFLYTRTELITW